MKWLILIIGPNHQVKDLKELVSLEYNNLNIIVVFVTNQKFRHSDSLDTSFAD